MPSTPQDHWTFTLNEWSSPPFTQITKELPNNIKCIWDIGANVGGWTELMHVYYPEAQFYCFEPVTRNFQALIANIPYATCLKLGIYYGATSSRVLWRGDNVGAFFVEQINAGEPRVETGEVMTLTTLEQLNLPMPDLVKMDVEGAEENIIEHSTLLSKVPNLIIEWHPNTEPLAFFTKYLPNHKIQVNLSDKQFYLSL